jgi:WD40 repeat protein
MKYFLGLLVVCAGVFVAMTYLKTSDDGDTGYVNGGMSGGTGQGGKNIADVRTSENVPSPENEQQPPGTINWNIRADVSRRLIAPIVIPDARMMPLDRQEVPSEREGRLLVIGTEIAPGEKVPDDKHFVATIGYLLVTVGEHERLKPEQIILGQDGRRWRRWQDGDTPEPGQVFLQKETKDYKRLEVGDEVKAGQTVAMVDAALAMGDANIKIAALASSESERRASVKTKEEAERRVAAMEDSMRRVPGSVSKDDYQGARLTAQRYFEEEIAKKSAVIKTQQELIQSNTILTKHEIHAAISGAIKIIYKNRGDAVKPYESVLQIQSHDRLRVEGNVDVQDTYRIKEKVTEVVIEPSQPIQQRLVLEGHFDEVTSVAVSRGSDPIILSASADRTLRGWSASTGRPLWSIPHRTAVLAVACAGQKAKQSLALAGCADGTARLIDLERFDAYAKGKSKEQPEPLLLKGQHRGAIHCVAFSPDGTICATGGEDRKIYLWSTETGERLHEVPSHHRAPVTSLQFTPQHQLVSAGRDYLLVVWSVEPGKPPVLVTQFDRRGGDVTQLGVSPDGNQVLFDQDKEIRLLSIKTHQPEGFIRNASGAATFKTLALYDPDGLTVLTNGSAEGLLQLWRTPTANISRAAELRQMRWQGAATSAAFSPDGTFLVTGMQDRHVLVWPMPERRRDESGRVELVDKEIRAKVTKVEEFIDSSNHQVPVFVELENKDNRLVPGGTATMVVLPDNN